MTVLLDSSAIRETIARVLAKAKPRKALLTFSKGNAKLGRNVYTFSLPAGYTCPGAQSCLALAVPKGSTARILDGPEATFRCFSASDEVRHKSARVSRWRNYRALEHARVGSADPSRAMADLILSSLPLKARMVRVHVSGDYYRPEYLRAWLAVATQRPDVTFYSYTKSVSLIMAERNAGRIPENFRFTLSTGGKMDSLIPASGIRTASVVLSEAEATSQALQLDHDDTHAQGTGPSFALVVHGAQAAGSEASRALINNRVKGFTGYSRKENAHANA